MSTHEHDRAMLEGQEVSASDLYFAARHEMLDTKDRRNVFKAGFERGWRVKEALAQPVAAEPSIDDRKDAERYRWLREEAQYFSIGRAPAVVLCDEHDLLEKGKTPCEPDGWGFISGSRLDAAIDAARAPTPS